MVSHLVIPDTQARPGLCDDHMVWAARYALEHKPDVIVHLGDHWDMPSLSSYDSTHAKVARGCDILSDIRAGNSALARFDDEIHSHNRRQNHRRRYKPRRVLLRGNHEERINRAIADDPMLSELLAAHPLESPGWEVVPFLVPIEVGQISYCHFYPRAANGCVMQSKRGAPSARAQCIREGRSATAGHKQGLDVARVTVGGGRVFRGIIAGSFEFEPAEYKSPQGQSYWRGILHKRNVRQGDYDLTEVHFETLRAQYATR